MAKIRDVCRYVRSKNAGPFWVTIDIFFTDETYPRYRDSGILSSGLVQDIYGADAALVKRFTIDDLKVIKLSYPRPIPQGGVTERDMHSGQQYVRLLDVELDGGL